jgi:hypothetical protein
MPAISPKGSLLGDLERALDRELAVGEQYVTAASGSLLDAERQISGAFDELSSQVAGAHPGGLDADDPHALGRVIAQLRLKQIEATRGIAIRGAEPLCKWTRGLREKIEPPLAGARALAAKVAASRAVLMAVEDEALTRKLISLALDPAAYEIRFVGDAPEALSFLCRERPQRDPHGHPPARDRRRVADRAPGGLADARRHSDHHDERRLARRDAGAQHGTRRRGFRRQALHAPVADDEA